jgi:hypothetical protein
MNGERLPAGLARFVVIVLGAELLVYLTVACGLAYIARSQDQILACPPPPRVVCCRSAALPAPTCERPTTDR